MTLSVGYNLDASIYNLIICHLHLQIVNLFDVLSTFHLILTSVGQIIVILSKALLQQRSTCHLAYFCTIIGILFHIHTLIASHIRQLASKAFLRYCQLLFDDEKETWAFLRV